MPAASPVKAVLGTAVILALAVSTGCAIERPASATGPARIAVMAPAAAEMIELLGGEDRIVGVGDYVRRPDAPSRLPTLGAYDAPNVERILELRVDLVVTADSRAADDAHRRLRELGVDVLALPTDTFDGVFESLTLLGDVLGTEDRAAARVAAMRAELNDVAERVEPLPRRTVLFVVGRDPLFVAGPGSHVDTMIRLAGGVNVAGDVGAPYRRMSLESALERMPEVVVDTSDNRPGATRGRVAGAWAQWTFLPAVAEDRVWHVAPDRLVIPGVRLPAMTRLLARLIHPEDLGEPDRDDLISDPKRGIDGVD